MSLRNHLVQAFFKELEVDKMPSRQTYKLNGEFIEELLRHYGMSTADLAEAAVISAVTVTNVATNGEPAEMRIVKKIADALNVSRTVIIRPKSQSREHYNDPLPWTVLASLFEAQVSPHVAQQVLDQLRAEWLGQHKFIVHLPANRMVHLPAKRVKPSSLLIFTDLRIEHIFRLVDHFASPDFSPIKNVFSDEGSFTAIIDSLLFPRRTLMRYQIPVQTFPSHERRDLSLSLNIQIPASKRLSSTSTRLVLKTMDSHAVT